MIFAYSNTTLGRNFLLRLLLAHLLLRGFEIVKKKARAATVLELHWKESLQIIIADIRMVGMDGIVDGHKAAIEVRSEVVQGATFTIRLPAKLKGEV
jgi:DNA-binding NarL/FixJ family response regulator